MRFSRAPGKIGPHLPQHDLPDHHFRFFLFLASLSLVSSQTSPHMQALLRAQLLCPVPVHFSGTNTPGSAGRGRRSRGQGERPAALRSGRGLMRPPVPPTPGPCVSADGMVQVSTRSRGWP